MQEHKAGLVQFPPMLVQNLMIWLVVERLQLHQLEKKIRDDKPIRVVIVVRKIGLKRLVACLYKSSTRVTFF